MTPQPVDWAHRSKVELHRHLEGCIRPRTAFELGQSSGQVSATESFERFRQTIVVAEPLPLLDVLACFDRVRRPIVGFDAVVRIAREAVEDAAAEHLELCELRFSPLTLAKAAGLSMDETKQAVQQGVDEARAAGAPVEVPLVVVLSRRHGLEAAWELVRHVEQDRGGCYVGVDFASDELRHRTAEFVEVARALAALGLPLTIHTGEGVGPEYVADALQLPNVARLGHALSLAEDPELVAQARDRGIVVEVCPTSTLRTGLAASYAEHPGKALFAAGVRIVICADDPALFDIDLNHELERARDDMGLSDADLERTQQWAREAAFAAQPT